MRQTLAKFEYDTNGNLSRLDVNSEEGLRTYDEYGECIEEINSIGTFSYIRDSRHNIIEVLKDGVFIGTYTITYNDRDQVIKTERSDGVSVTYDYRESVLIGTHNSTLDD